MIIITIIPYLVYILPLSTIFIIISSLCLPWYEIVLDNGDFFEFKVFNYIRYITLSEQKLKEYYFGSSDNMFTTISAVLIVSLIFNGVASMISYMWLVKRSKLVTSLSRNLYLMTIFTVGVALIMNIVAYSMIFSITDNFGEFNIPEGYCPNGGIVTINGGDELCRYGPRIGFNLAASTIALDASAAILYLIHFVYIFIISPDFKEKIQTKLGQLNIGSMYHKNSLKSMNAIGSVNNMMSNSISTYIVPPHLQIKLTGFYQFQLQTVPINIKIGDSIPSVSYHQFLLKPIFRKTKFLIRSTVLLQFLSQMAVLALILASFCKPWYEIFDINSEVYIFYILSYEKIDMFGGGGKSILSYSGMDIQGTFVSTFSFYILSLVCSFLSLIVLALKMKRKFLKDPMMRVSYFPLVNSIFISIGFFSFFSLKNNLSDDNIIPRDDYPYGSGFVLGLAAMIVSFSSSLLCLVQLVLYRRQRNIRGYRSEQLKRDNIHANNLSIEISQHRLVNSHPLITIPSNTTIDPDLVYSVQYELSSTTQDDSYFEFKFMLQPAYINIPTVRFNQIGSNNINSNEIEKQPLLLINEDV